MNTKETQKELWESGKTDIIRKIRDRSQTAKIASAVGGAVLALLPATAKAEPLGTKLDSDYESLAGGMEDSPQLSPGTTKDRWKMTFEGFIDDWTSMIFGKEFRIKNGPNNSVIIETLNKSTVEYNCSPFNEIATCFYIMNADGTVKHIVSDYGVVTVDGQDKWSGCEGPDSIHPSKNKEEIKIVKSTGVSGVFRVPIKSTNYCADKVKDTTENTGFETFNAPETQDLVALTFYKPKPIDAVKIRFKARDTNGNLIGLNRNSDGTWIAVTPSQDKDDFPEVMGWPESPRSMLERETPDGRKVTIIMTLAETTRIYVLEKHLDWTPENPKWSEVPATVEAVYEADPNFVLDDDNDKVPNSVEEASGGCIGYTDADKVDVNGDGKSDACGVECGVYANELAGAMTASDALPCASNLGYESAKQLKDGSTLHYNGSAPALGADGKIIAQSSSKLRYIHSTLVGAVPAPESARNVALPNGYNSQIKVNSGTAHVSGLDFLGEPVEFTVTPESGSVDLGFIYGAETGIEGSDVEFTIGSEYQPCGVAVCGDDNPEPPAAEPTQTVEVPTQAEPVQTEPPAQVELPSQAEAPTQQPEPVTVAEAPASLAEPTPEPVAEPTPDVVENSPETVDTGSIIIPPADVTVSSPEVDAVVYVDTPPVSPDTAQNPDTKQAEPDTQPAPDTASDTPSSEDTADAGNKQDLQAGVDAAKTDNAPSTDAPVQSEDTQPGTPDTLQNADMNQQNQPDTVSQPDKPKDGGGGGGCAIENPNDPSALNTLMVFGAGIAAWALRRRKRMREIFKK